MAFQTSIIQFHISTQHIIFIKKKSDKHTHTQHTHTGP